jgi:hypothetical protein
VRPASRVLLVRRDPLVLQGPLDPQVQLALLVFKVPPVRQDLPELKVSPVLRAHKVPLDRSGPQDRKDLQESLVPPVRRDQQDQ